MTTPPLLNQGHSGEVVFCCVEGCGNSTTSPESDNPRERWITGMQIEMHSDSMDIKLADQDTPEHLNVKVSFCPSCVLRHMNLDDDFFQVLRRTEDYVTDYIRVVQK